MISGLFRRRAAAAMMAGFIICVTAVVRRADGADAYASVTGPRSGPISKGASGPASLGSMADQKHVDEITVIGWDQRLLMPVDPNTGMPYGSPRTEGYSLTKYLDSASPPFQHALITGEELEITLNLYRTGAEGLAEQHYSIRLIRTMVVGQKQLGANREELRLMPRRIEQTHTLSHISSLIVVPVEISGFSVE